MFVYRPIEKITVIPAVLNPDDVRPGGFLPQGMRAFHEFVLGGFNQELYDALKARDYQQVERSFDWLAIYLEKFPGVSQHLYYRPNDGYHLNPTIVF